MICVHETKWVRKNRNFYLGLLLVFVLIGRHSANAQESTIKDSLSGYETKNRFIPIVFYLPETSLSLGAAGIFTFKKNSAPESQRKSQILYSAAYTLKNQILLYAPYEIYSHSQKYRYKGELGFYRYFYNYFGVGPRTQKDVLELYEVTFPRLEFSATRFFKKHFGFGVGFRGDYFNITHIEPGGLLDTERPIGYQGGIKSNLLALMLFDNRDNINAPKKGIYAEVIYQKSAQFLGSDFDYQKWEIDFRAFQDLGADVVLAHELWLTIATDGIPFFDMAHLSTGARARGMSDRRFINFDIYSLQSELRFPIWNRFRGAAFYSVNHIPEQRNNFKTAYQAWSYGLGLRYILDKQNRNCIRLDIGTAERKFNFYLTVNEAF